MRLGVVVDEALRDLAARWVLTVLVAVVALGAGASTVLLVAREVDHVRAVWDEQVADGRFVLVVGGTRGPGVGAASCAAVADWPGVLAAGGRVATGSVRLVTAPASRYDLAQVTPGYLRVLWPGTSDPAADEVVVGPHAASSTGLRPGSAVAWAPVGAGAADRVDAVVTTVPRTRTARDPSADRQLFAVVPATGTVDRCLVDVDPDQYAAVLPALRAWFGDAAAAPQPVVDLTRAVDPEVALAERASAWWWALAGATVVAAAAASWAVRRPDVALHRLLGADTGTVAVRLAVDVIVAVVTPLLAGVAVAGIAVAPLLAHDVVRAVVLADAGRLLVAVTVLPVLGLAVVGRGSVFRALKEG